MAMHTGRSADEIHLTGVLLHEHQVAVDEALLCVVLRHAQRHLCVTSWAAVQTANLQRCRLRRNASLNNHRCGSTTPNYHALWRGISWGCFGGRA